MTPTETQIYELYIDLRLTPKAIAARLKTSPNNIYVHLHNLRKKGFINPTGHGNLKKNEGEYLKKDLRLDGMQWKINIIAPTEKYHRQMLKSNVIPDFLGVYVVMYKDSIEAYSKVEIARDHSAQDVAAAASDFWLRWARKLENRLGIVILKSGYQNWKLVKSGDFAREASAVAQKWTEGGEKFAIHSPTDGKVFYWVDWSKWRKGIGPEDETVHPMTSKLDRERIDKHYVDWHMNDPMTNTELQGALSAVLRVNTDTSGHVKEIGAGLRGLLDFVTKQLPSTEPQELPKDVRKPDYFG